jgi:GNAT superfamily N-acetyltransferase
MTIAVQRLDAGMRPAVLAHFLALPTRDRSLRFGAAVAPELVAAYVDRIDFGRDAVLGVRDDQRTLVGVAHVAVENSLAEVGLSVLPASRGRGIGAALFERAIDFARNRSIPRLLINFLAANAPIMHIARRFGMAIATGCVSASAELELPPASPASGARLSPRRPGSPVPTGRDAPPDRVYRS